MICFYNAYGDNIHMSVVIEELRKKYGNIYMDTNNYGLTLFCNDPRIRKISYFEPSIHFNGTNLAPGIQQHIKAVRDKYPTRDVIDFFGFTDYQFIDTELEPYKFEHRKQTYGRNWHEMFFERAGLKRPKDFSASYPSIIFLPDLIAEIEKQWYIPNKKYFRILIPLGGSTRNKGFPGWIAEFGKRLIDSLPKAKIFTLGDEYCTSLEWKYPRTVHLSHRQDRPQLPMVNAIIMTMFANYVIGPETGILSAAGMYGTPKTTLCTCSSVEQLCKYHNNDYSIQAQIGCSPCFRTCFHGPSRQKEPCPKSEEVIYPMLPQCTDKASFDLDNVFHNIEREYGTWDSSGK